MLCAIVCSNVNDMSDTADKEDSKKKKKKMFSFINEMVSLRRRRKRAFLISSDEAGEVKHIQRCTSAHI